MKPIVFMWLMCFAAALFFDAKLGLSHETSPVYYVENKGQIIDPFGCPDASVRYSLALPGMNLHLRSGGFSYDTYLPLNEETHQSGNGNFGMDSGILPPRNDSGFPHEIYSRKQEQSSPLYSHRVDVKFVGAHPQPEIIAEEQAPYFSTYYTAGTHRSSGVTRRFRTITYREIYPFIDIVFRVRDDGSPEYDIVVRPGGDARRVKLQYEGQNSIALRKGAIELGLWGGVLTERLPRGYERETNRDLDVKYTLAGATVGFEVSDQPAFATMIIDPTPLLVWGRYYGGGNRDQAEDMALDNEGNIYLTGTTSSTANIATSGTFQSVLRRDFDVYIAKFTPAGEQIWGTYYGGLYFETGNAIAVNANAVVIAGSAESDSMATDSALQTAKYGFSDCITAVFTPDSGQIRWATYIGGDSVDNGYGVAFDANGDIYVAGAAVSSGNISTPGSYQEEYRKGIVHGDAFLIKFNPDGKRLWGTYFGGEYDDYGYDVTTDPAGNVYLAGATRSFAYIGTTNSHQPDRVAGDNPFQTDGFFVKFSTEGFRLWATYYGGSGTDYFYGATADNTGAIYLCGWTTSSEGIASPAGYRTLPADTVRGDAFVVKFNPNGGRQWASYYGGGDLDFARDISVDKSGNVVYITGITNSPDGIARQGAHQSERSSGSDGFVAKFNVFGQFNWGTYYGSNGTDYINAVATDKTGAVYTAGWTESNTGIATTGSEQTFRRGDRDAFIGKFDPVGTDVETDFPNKPAAELALTATQDNGGIRVNFQTAKSCQIVVRLVDISGREASARSFICETGATTLMLPADGLAAGIYAVTVSDGLAVAGVTVGITR